MTCLESLRLVPFECHVTGVSTGGARKLWFVFTCCCIERCSVACGLTEGHVLRVQRGLGAVLKQEVRALQVCLCVRALFLPSCSHSPGPPKEEVLPGLKRGSRKSQEGEPVRAD